MSRKPPKCQPNYENKPPQLVESCSSTFFTLRIILSKITRSPIVPHFSLKRTTQIHAPSLVSISTTKKVETTLNNITLHYQSSKLCQIESFQDSAQLQSARSNERPPTLQKVYKIWFLETFLEIFDESFSERNLGSLETYVHRIVRARTIRWDITCKKEQR